MSPAQIAVYGAIAECGYLPEDKITPEQRSTEDMGLDSLDRVELAIEIESRTRLEFSDDELGKLRTVADLVALVARKKLVGVERIS